MATSLVQKRILGRYRYDTLDIVVACVTPEDALTQRFYHQQRLSAELQSDRHKRLFGAADMPLALHQNTPVGITASLTASDQQGSLLFAASGAALSRQVYTPFGHHQARSGLDSLHGFNGQRPEPVTGHYLLGNGYRAFSPVLMRFTKPDSWSPFGRGGINSYAYCANEPVNRSDASGHEWQSLLTVGLTALGFFGSLLAHFPTPGFRAALNGLRAGERNVTNVGRIIGTPLSAVGLGMSVARLVVAEKDPNSSALTPLLISAGLFSSLGVAGGAASAISNRGPKNALHWMNKHIYHRVTGKFGAAKITPRSADATQPAAATAIPPVHSRSPSGSGHNLDRVNSNHFNAPSALPVEKLLQQYNALTPRQQLLFKNKIDGQRIRSDFGESYV